MKAYYVCLPLLFLFFLPVDSIAAIGVPAPVEVAAESVADMDRNDVEARLGRKLNLRERISFGIAKRKAQRASESQGETALGNGMAIAGFVCGVVSLFVGAIILGPLAVVFSAIGLSKSSREGRPLKGLAIAGLILGVVATIAGLIIVAAVA